MDVAKQRKHHTLPATLLDLQVLMTPLLSQLRSVASICLTQNFIDTLTELWEEEELIRNRQKEGEGEDDDFHFRELLFTRGKARNRFTAANLGENFEVKLERVRQDCWLDEK